MSSAALPSTTGSRWSDACRADRAMARVGALMVDRSGEVLSGSDTRWATCWFALPYVVSKRPRNTSSLSACRCAALSALNWPSVTRTPSGLLMPPVKESVAVLNSRCSKSMSGLPCPSSRRLSTLDRAAGRLDGAAATIMEASEGAPTALWGRTGLGGRAAVSISSRLLRRAAIVLSCSRLCAFQWNASAYVETGRGGGARRLLRSSIPNLSSL
mmetsp:Transcript_4477/g.10342  ORF Transcript_4477/g.10342 Transcript_4477/m.10342 type:complete len:214 (+) Transcript_4477:232-873(+)